MRQIKTLCMLYLNLFLSSLGDVFLSTESHTALSKEESS
jgi:hypothetical protein